MFICLWVRQSELFHSLKLVIKNCKNNNLSHRYELLAQISPMLQRSWDRFEEYEYPNKRVNDESATVGYKHIIKQTNLLDRNLIGWFGVRHSYLSVQTCVTTRQLLTNFRCYYLFFVSSLLHCERIHKQA